MNNMDVSQLEDLPVETLIEIFQYLSVHELYFSFSHLNTRFNSIIKSLPNLILITASHDDPVFSFFYSFGAIQIHFNYPTSSCLSQYNFLHFIGIRSFIISSINTCAFHYSQPIEQIDTFIRPDLCPQLRSLRIPFYSQQLVDWIFTGAFPHLEICHLYNRRYAMIALPSTTNNTLQNLRQLTIHRRETCEFEQILLQCPNLTYFEFSCNNSLPPFVDLNSPYLSLKRLQLSRLENFFFHNGQFDSLLCLFPNLHRFNLMVDNSFRNNETIDFRKIAHCLHQRLPHLTVLELRISCGNYPSLVQHTLTEIVELHPLFKFLRKMNELIHVASFDITSVYHDRYSYVCPFAE